MIERDMPDGYTPCSAGVQSEREVKEGRRVKKQSSPAIKIASKARFYWAQAVAKLNRRCERCGYRDDADALQFDHVVPLHIRTRSRPKTLRIESMRSLRLALLDPNIQVLCGNCHNIKSVRERRVN